MATTLYDAWVAGVGDLAKMKLAVFNIQNTGGEVSYQLNWPGIKMARGGVQGPDTINSMYRNCVACGMTALDAHTNYQRRISESSISTTLYWTGGSNIANALLWAIG